MSYLTLPKGLPDFSKAVISLWFRAPKESVTAAADNRIATDVEGFSMMQGVLPLVTFGQPQQNKNYVANPEINVAVDVEGAYEPDPVYMTSTGYTSEAPYDVDPCFIGILCASDGTFRLAFNIQTGTEMETSATTFVTTSMNYLDPTKGLPPGVPPEWISEYQYADIQDASYSDNDQPQWFHVESYEYFDPDEWHHVLLSFDIGGGVSIGQPFASSSCSMWYAIDDVDYRGQDHMGPHRGLSSGGGSNVDNLGDNTIITYTAWRLSSEVPDFTPVWTSEPGFYYEGHAVPAPSGAYDGGSIPASNAALGVPASVQYVDGIFRVEMAELQIFTGVTLDTGVERNRRAFVDADGKPVKPSTLTKPGAAENLLGKRPDILLHGSGDWKAGKNTGSLGLKLEDDEEVVIQSGQFVRTAGIERYKPDPSLDKTTA